MSCRIHVADMPTAVRLRLEAPVDERDVATVEAAVQVALEDGHHVLVDVAGCPLPRALLRCLARLAERAPGPASVTVRGADEVAARYLRARRLDTRLTLEAAVPSRRL